jgi:hypothetical protein
MRAIEEGQEVLMAELQERFPDLYKQVLGSPPPPPPPGPSSWGCDVKDHSFSTSQAPLVGPLSRALEKMQEAGAAPPPGPDQMGDSYSGKMAGEGYHMQQQKHHHRDDGGEAGSKDYDEVGPMNERLSDEPGFPSPGDLTGSSPGAGGGEGGASDSQKKQRQQPGFLRSARSWIKGARS